MDRKSMIQMIVTIAVVIAIFFALQAWVIPKRQPPANTPAENKPAGDPPKITDPSPASQKTSEPTEAEKARGFEPITRSNANKAKLANEKLTAVFSDRGGVLESLVFIDEKGDAVFLQTPDDPTVHASTPLELIRPVEEPSGIAALALKLDANDKWRNTSRWEASGVSTDGAGNKLITYRFPPAGKTESDGTVVFKTFKLLKNTFRLEVSLRIENSGDKAVEKNIGLWGPPALTNDNIRGGGDYARVAMYGSTENKRYIKDKGGDAVTAFESKLADYNEHLSETKPGSASSDAVDSVWFDGMEGHGYYLMVHGLRTRYFLAVLGADFDQTSAAWSGHIKPVTVAFEHSSACSLVAPKLEVAKGGKAETRMSFYAGPRDKAALEAAWEAAPPKDGEIPLHWQELAPPGWPWIVTAPLSGLLKWMSTAVGPGLAIIFLTLIVRLSLSPLSFKGQKSMSIYTKKMKVVKPKLDALKEKYANRKDRDSQLAMLQETRDAMRAENVGFFPFGGCLPVLMQMPIFIGLYQTFANSFFLRQASFGWLHDLSMPDATIPFSFTMNWLPGFLAGFLTHNGFFTINLLPLAWIALSIIQMKMQPKPDDPQQAAMQKQMGCMFPIMGMMFYSFASGFALYFIVSSLYSLAETKIIKRYLIAKGIMDPPKPKVVDLKPDYHGTK